MKCVTRREGKELSLITIPKIGCENCGKPVRIFKNGRVAKLCLNPTCRSQYYNKQNTSICNGCGVEYKTTLGEIKGYCTKKCWNQTGAAGTDSKCLVCNSSFVRKIIGQECCSHQCSGKRRRKHEKIECETCGKVFRPTRADSKYCDLQCLGEANSNRLYEKFCIVCGNSFLGNSYKASICSDKCRDSHAVNKEYNGKYTALNVCPCGKLLAGKKYCDDKCNKAAQRRARATQVHMCVCGTEYQGRKYRNGCEDCRLKQKRLKHQQAKARRRARKRAIAYQPINNEKIFARDGWRCAYCNRKVYPRNPHKPNKPKEATLDHVIPISKGGKHIEENVVCACRECNSLKSDKVQTLF